MAKAEHIKILKQGVSVWNNWRNVNPEESYDLRGADLYGEDLRGAYFSGVDFSGADLSETFLAETNFNGANLSGVKLNGTKLYGTNFVEANLFETDLSNAVLWGAHLIEVDLRKTILLGTDLSDAHLNRAILNGKDLRKTILSGTDLFQAKLIGANLSGVNMMGAILVETNFHRAILKGAFLARSIMINTDLTHSDLTNCSIYGISAWDLKLDKVKQTNLIITPQDSPVITVDNLEVAQFIYLLLHNEKIREVIDTITSKVVLILGRFTKARKPILDAIRNELRQYDYVPVMFDYEKPKSKSFIETVITLANLARFVIADVTNAKIVIQEIPQIVQSVAVPIVPLLSSRAKKEIITLSDVRVGHTFILDTFRYKDVAHLMASLKDEIIGPAEDKAKELTKERKL